MVRAAPVSTFWTTTVTPGTKPPLLSFTTPVMVPVVSCAHAPAGAISNITSKTRLRWSIAISLELARKLFESRGMEH